MDPPHPPTLHHSQVLAAASRYTPDAVAPHQASALKANHFSSHFLPDWCSYLSSNNCQAAPWTPFEWTSPSKSLFPTSDIKERWLWRDCLVSQSRKTQPALHAAYLELLLLPVFTLVDLPSLQASGEVWRWAPPTGSFAQANEARSGLSELKWFPENPLM